MEDAHQPTEKEVADFVAFNGLEEWEDKAGYARVAPLAAAFLKALAEVKAGLPSDAVD